jgi:secondary thiamine-phosphate synthase enzyme
MPWPSRSGPPRCGKEWCWHNETGADDAAAHLRSLTVGHEVIVPITKGKLDLGPWQRICYGEWDGQRRKRLVIKVLGE